MGTDVAGEAARPWLRPLLGLVAVLGVVAAPVPVPTALAQAPAAPAAPPDASAEETTIYGGLNVEDWVTLAQENGVAEVTLDPESSRTGENIKTLNARIAGLDTRLTLYECDADGDCSGIVFTTYFDDKDKFTPALLNKFNSERIAHLVLVDESLRLELTTAFGGGVTRAFLADQLNLFVSTVTDAVEFKP